MERKPNQYVCCLIDYVSIESKKLMMNGTTCTVAKIAPGGVAPTPRRATEAETAITGQTVNDANADAAATKAMASAVPLSKNAYKVVITKALIKRAILA